MQTQALSRFNHGMIATYLEGTDFQFLRDRSGDYVVDFGYDEEILGHPRFHLIVSGDDGDQYCARGETLTRIQRADWDRTLRLCNEWNAQFKLPKVYLEIDDPNVSTTGQLVCEQWISLGAGIYQEQFNHLTTSFLSACFGFWRWLDRQNAIEALTDPDPRD